MQNLRFGSAIFLFFLALAQVIYPSNFVVANLKKKLAREKTYVKSEYQRGVRASGFFSKARKLRLGARTTAKQKPLFSELKTLRAANGNKNLSIYNNNLLPTTLTFWAENANTVSSPASNSSVTFKAIEDLSWLPNQVIAGNGAQKILDALPDEFIGADLEPQAIEVKTYAGFRILEDIPSHGLGFAKPSAASSPENSYNIFISRFFKKNYNIELEGQENQKLYAFISRWHRTPYRWGGSSIRGTDCSGLVGVIADSLYQIKLPRDAGSIFKVCTPLPKDSLREGDLVFFIQGSYIFHVGLYLKDNKFVHASSGFGVIVSDLNEPYYKRFFFAGGRLKHNNVE
jgi:lipoprotein Spr